MGLRLSMWGGTRRQLARERVVLHCSVLGNAGSVVVVLIVLQGVDTQHIDRYTDRHTDGHPEGQQGN